MKDLKIDGFEPIPIGVMAIDRQTENVVGMVVGYSYRLGMYQLTTKVEGVYTWAFPHRIREAE